MDHIQLTKEFLTVFGGENQDIYCHFTSGRVNLIGEHTDYNGGYVFPAAISLGIYAVFRKRNDENIFLKSDAFEEIEQINPTKDLSLTQSWTDYCKGVVHFLRIQNLPVSGHDIYFKSTLPMGSGLSSSACMEILCTTIFLGKTNFSSKERVELSLFAKKVENEFIGLNCGIMDMFSIALGEKQKAVLLHCDETLEYELVNIDFNPFKLLIINSNKPRKLIESKYNERKAECDKVLEILNQTYQFKSISEASVGQVEERIEDVVLKKRALHVIMENERVLESAKALAENNLREFGRLMNESHQSLKDNYEVTGIELDTIATEAIRLEGCIGARMTGAGFGGCCIALVDTKKIDDFKKKLNNHYIFEIGYALDFYEVEISDGIASIS